MGSNAGRAACVVGLALVLTLGCGSADETPSLPAGAWVVGDGAPVRAFAADLSRLSGTPLADSMGAMLERTRGCSRIVAHEPDGGLGGLIDGLRCADEGGVPQALDVLQGDGDFAFVLSPAEGLRVSGSGRRAEDGSVRIAAELHAPAVTGLARLLVPDSEPAGPPLLAGRDSLLHARVRPQGGLRLADVVASGGQADRLFRLKSQLFEGAALGGAWEIAVYPPPEGLGTPALALALDVRSLSVVQRGVDEFVADLERTWPLRHRPVRIAGAAGACFPELRILPDFTPCWVLTEAALIVGWNPASVEKAVSGPSAVDGLGQDGGVLVRLGSLSGADRRMQAVLTGAEPAPPVEDIDYVWQRLAVRPRQQTGGLRFEIDLIGVGEES